jgi:RNA polymerase sigma factor (TIGR02999 family)
MQESSDQGVDQTIGEGDGPRALTGEGFEDLHAELHEIACRLFRSQGPRHTLQATALVNEAYVKIARGKPVSRRFRDRTHLLAVAATAMRQILVNHARDRAALKRGGGAGLRRVTLSGVAGDPGGTGDVLAVNEALADLADLVPRQARITEMKFFGGMTNREIASALGVSLRTVELDWTMAKGWLSERLVADRED